MASKEEILQFVKQNGPVIPNDVKKELGSDTFMISALLSELKSNGHVKVTHTKVGGSPAYYAPGQESKLENLKKHLNEKDQRTVDRLKEKKVLRDKEEEMLIRVSLRKIKDFAKALEVNVRGEKEIFWKWHLTPRDEVEKLIRERFAKNKPQVESKKEPEEKQEKQKEEEEDTEKKEESSKQETEEKKTEEKKQKEDKKEQKKKKKSEDEFLQQLHEYFDEKDIEIVKENVVRKNSDIELQIKIPSPVGNMQYFCKARNKKRCNDGDLSSAHIKGQSLKLPVMFITTGEVTNKAEDMMDEEFKGMMLKKI